jgi:uncharacterized membrane protein
VLAIAGAITHRQGLSLAALMVLLTVVLAPALVAGRLPAWLIWTGGSAGMLALASRGLLPVVLDLVPVLVNALLAWFFGRTLLAGRQPLIAHFIASIEGPSRLALPGVARYARHLTAFWAGLLLCWHFCWSVPGPVACLPMSVCARRWRCHLCWQRRTPIWAATR